jgi:hypothetical protein
MKVTITTKEAIRNHYKKERERLEALAINKADAIEATYKDEATALAKFDIEGGQIEVDQTGKKWTF